MNSGHGWAMKPRVLIVDDEPDYLQLMQFNLLGQGFEVVGAGSGLQALQKARCESPDVILLDVMLPDLNGFAVCEILQALPSTRGTPVIVLSALDAQAMRERGARLRIARWIKKGEVDIKSLGEYIQTVCEEQERLTKAGAAEQA